MTASVQQCISALTQSVTKKSSRFEQEANGKTLTENRKRIVYQKIIGNISRKNIINSEMYNGTKTEFCFELVVATGHWPTSFEYEMSRDDNRSGAQHQSLKLNETDSFAQGDYRKQTRNRRRRRSTQGNFQHFITWIFDVNCTTHLDGKFKSFSHFHHAKPFPPF